MDAILKIVARLKGLISIEKGNSHKQKISTKQNSGNFSPVNGDKNISIDKNVGNSCSGNNNTQTQNIFNLPAQKKSPLESLESWMRDLDSGDIYKSRADVVNLFCRHVIPLIQKHINLRDLVTDLRARYESAVCESAALQKEVFQDSERVFKEVSEEIQKLPKLTSSIKNQVTAIQAILAGDRRRMGYTNWPLYREVYWDVKDLLMMLLNEGEHSLCSRYAIIDKNSAGELYVSEFVFAPAIQKAVDMEEMFDPRQTQEPFVVWKYFETALHFWNAKHSDLEQELNELFKSNPFKAMGTRSAWLEIAQIKNGKKNSEEPLIFKVALFKNGLRTLINEITTFLEISQNEHTYK